jgi:hypothetical protein
VAIVPGPPLAITGPGVYSVPYPGGGTQPQGSPGQWTTMKLENASPYGLTVAYSGTPVFSLPAGTADVFPLSLGPSGPGAPPTSPVTAPAPSITATVAIGAQTAQVTTGTLRPSFGQFGDVFPGVYPVSLTAQAIAASTQSAVIASIPAGSTSQTIQLPGWVTSVELLSNAFPPGAFIVQGATSGIFYFANAAAVVVSPLSFDVASGVDKQLIIQWTGAAGSPIYVIGLSAPAYDHSVSTPSIISATDPNPNTNHAGVSVNCPSGTSVTLLAAPPAGFVWEIVLLNALAATTVFGPAAAYLSVTGLTSGVNLIGNYSQTTGIWVTTACQMFLNESLGVHNSTLVAASANVMYRPVVLH